LSVLSGFSYTRGAYGVDIAAVPTQPIEPLEAMAAQAQVTDNPLLCLTLHDLNQPCEYPDRLLADPILGRSQHGRPI
jgi:hypothetical protein